MSDDFDPDTQEHPALKSFSRTTEQVKHVMGKAIRHAAMGAVAVGGVAAAAALAFGAATPLGWIVAGGTYLGGLVGIGPGVLGGLGGIFMNGAIAGGALGMATGLATGIGSADEAADIEAERRIAAWNRRESFGAMHEAEQEQRTMRKLAMAQQMEPNPGNLPYMGGGMGRGA